MTLGEARKILGLGPDEDPRPHLGEFHTTRERIAEMVRSAPNETIALRYQAGLIEFDQALAAVREYLEALGLLQRPSLVVTPPPPPAAVEIPPPPAPRRSPLRAVSALVVVLLAAGAAGGWLHLKFEEDRRLDLLAELARLESTGAAFIENRSWPEAIEVFDRIDQLAPGSEIATLGRRSIEAGMTEEQEQFVGYWSGRARASLEAGLLDDAESAARQVVQKFPNEPESTGILSKITIARTAEDLRKQLAAARARFDENQWDETILLAEAILAKHPGREDAAAIIADSRDAIRRAEQDLSKARALLAAARERDQGVFDQQALDWLREAAALAPAEPEITAFLEKMSSYSRTLRVPGDFPTPIEALAEARDNDRVLIAEGRWLGPLAINAAVEIQGAGPAKTIIQCPAESGSAVTFGPQAKGARMTGLSLRHDSFEAAIERFSAALVRGGTVTFVDCHFSDASGNGLAVIEAGHVIVTRCRFNGNGWNGIAAIGPGSLLEVRDSEALGNFEHGIESWDGAAIILSNNRCEGNSRNGIHADNGTASARIENNRLFENREFGIVVGSAAAGSVTGNTCRGNLLGGIVLRNKAAAVAVAGNEILRNNGPGLILERGLPAAAYTRNTITANVGQPTLADADFTPEPDPSPAAPDTAEAAPAAIDPP